MGVVQHLANERVDGVRHARPRVHPPEAEQRVRAHLRRFTGLGHQALAEAHHDGVVLGQVAGQVPQALAHDVGGDGVGGLLHLVVGLLVLALAGAEVAEELGAERGGGGGHGEAAGDAARGEGVRGDGLGLRALHLDVVEPEVKPQQHGAGVEGPLRDEVPLVRFVHGDLPRGA